jgi:hypothetical protein
MQQTHVSTIPMFLEMFLDKWHLDIPCWVQVLEVIANYQCQGRLTSESI